MAQHRRPSGSSSLDVQNNGLSPKAMFGRRSNAATVTLPSTGDDEAKVDDSMRGLRRQGHAWKDMVCSYRRGAVLTLFVMVVVYLVLETSLDSSSAAEPCQVASDTAERLKRLKAESRSSEHDSFPSDWKPELPKIIHHQWKDENIPDKYKDWHEKWYELYPEPEYTHMLWTDESARYLIKEHYPWFLRTYDEYDYPIQRADAARYFYLHFHGGLHTDLDYEPFVNFFEHLPTDRVGLVESPYKFNEEAQNSLMSSPKGDPFWLNVFTELIRNKDKSILSATGPKLMGTALKSSRHAVHFLPCENFHRIPSGESRLTDIPRDVYGKFYPMKKCGSYENKSCQFAKHHNTASYVADFNWRDHLFNI